MDTGRIASKLTGAEHQLAQFISETGGKVNGARTGVSGFGRSQASKATLSAKISERIDVVNNGLNRLRENGTIRMTGTAVLPPPVPESLHFGQHSLSQMVDRKISLIEAEGFAESAIMAVRQRSGQQYAYYSDKGFIVIGSDGIVATVGYLDAAGIEIVKEMKKHGFY